MSRVGIKRKRVIIAFLFILPAMASFITFRIFPIIYAFFLSLFNIKILGSLKGVSFVGLENYLDLCRNAVFWRVVANTLLYAAIIVPITASISLGLALLLNKKFKLAKLFETIYFLPIVTSMVAISAIWSMLYQANFGLINHLFSLIGLAGPAWLLDAKYSLISVAIVIIWTNIGYYIVIFLGGLNNIPRLYYEAARIDGANDFTCFTKITLPLLKPIILFVIVMLTMISLKVFTPVYMLTRGGPMDSSKPLVLLLYQYGFEFYRYSYATTIAVALFMIILAITLLEFKFFR